TQYNNKDRVNLNYFLCRYSGTLYCFIKNQTNETDESGKPITEMIIKVLKDGSSDWVEPEPYIPLVMNHCKTDGHIIMSVGDILDNGGVMWEAFNLLSDKYRMVYSTVNKKLFDDYHTSHSMYYSLYYSVNDFIGSTVTAKLTLSTGTYTHKVQITNRGYNRETSSEDGYYMSVQGRRVEFYSDPEFKNIATVESVSYIGDNLEITAPCPCYKENLEKIFNMTRCEWFGGTSSGVNGGIRLFLGANSKEEDSSLLLWSGADNPLYFPENAYSYVGNTVTDITSFGKQEDMLVIFKDNELFFTQFTQKTGITNKGLVSLKAYDYEISQVNFPLKQVHSAMGCDCPDTVELCRNRLVWANRNGKVYSLTNDGEYSERNIFTVSEMTQRLLKGEILKNSYSADWDGYYVLFVGNHIYLMDYNSYGYQYISSYSKTEDANIRIPWYYWEIDSKGGKFLTVDGTLNNLKAELKDNKLCISLMNLNGDTDNGIPIRSMAQTKFFDFKEPNRRKNIESLGITFGNNGGTPITVRCITEIGEDRDTVTLNDKYTKSRSPGYIVSRIINPSIRSVVRFGVCLECKSNMAVEGINISYTVLGKAR
ncbi:MAG: hypothetical protein IKK24_03295, partial [Clostridia bacterium]|nr:hypothetical protein [Clostridia bacterium]